MENENEFLRRAKAGMESFNALRAIKQDNLSPDLQERINSWIERDIRAASGDLYAQIDILAEDNELDYSIYLSNAAVELLEGKPEEEVKSWFESKLGRPVSQKDWNEVLGFKKNLED